MCGCCWAFGTAEAASDRLCIATDGATIVPLSAQDLCFNSNKDGCNGGAPEMAWSWIAKNGIVSGKQQAFTATGASDVLLARSCSRAVPPSLAFLYHACGLIRLPTFFLLVPGKNPDPFADASTCSDFSLPHCHHHGPIRDDPFPPVGSEGCPQQKSPQGPTKCDADSKLTYAGDKVRAAS